MHFTQIWDMKRQLKMCAGVSVFTVLCFMALHSNVAAKNVLLDMAPDAVDDQYKGCIKDALNKFVLSDLLKEELNHSEVFQKAWRSQVSRCPKLIPGGLKEHTTALRTVSTGGDNFKTTLNNAVYSHGTNVTTYEVSFHFKSLHFLLMDSIRLLHPGTCKTVYAFSEPKFEAQNGSRVRFGRFYAGYSSFETLKKERDLDDEVMLSVTTCFFADLGENICLNDQMTVFSPAEEFTVEDVRTVREPDDVTYKMMVLKHSQLKSVHNCYVFSRSHVIVWSHWLVLALVASFIFISG